jgi:hypothetical protein
MDTKLYCPNCKKDIEDWDTFLGYCDHCLGIDTPTGYEILLNAVKKMKYTRSSMPNPFASREPQTDHLKELQIENSQYDQD